MIFRHEGKPVRVYTDASYRPDYSLCGWGVVVMEGSRSLGSFNGVVLQERDSFRSEMIAVIEGLKLVKCANKKPVIVYSDCQSLIHQANDWLDDWTKNGFRKPYGDRIKNADLWGEIALHSAHLNVRWWWVRGHSKNKWNKAAHLAADKAIRQHKNQSLLRHQFA